MSHWIYAVDGSYDELTPAEAARLKAAGVQAYAQCLWTGREQPAVRVISLRNALNAGLKIIGYFSVSNNGHDGAWHVAQGRAGVPDDIWAAMVKVPVDVELTGLDFNVHVVRALDTIAALGKPRDVYTSYNAWVNYLGNPTRPAGTGLWNAIWNLNPDFDFPTLRFGGWQDNEVWGEQWSGGTNVEGQNADRDQFRANAIGIADPPPPVTDNPVPPVLVTPRPPFAILLKLKGNPTTFLVQAWWVPNPATLEALKAAGVPGPIEVSL